MSVSTLANAQSVPDGTDLSTLPAPNAATVWTLQGSASLPSLLQLPTGSPGLTINGQTGSVITLNNGGGSYGYFNAAASATFNLSSVTLTGGIQAIGGAVHGDADITINGGGSVVFSGNQATNFGGAVYATGAITITNASFDGNTGVVSGGAIESESSTVSLTNVTASNNSATSAVSGYGFGGAINANAGNVIMNNVILSGNTATGGGGGVYAQGAVTAADLTATDNHATGSNGTLAFGGAILAFTGDVTLSGTTTMSGNSAQYGGAIAAYGSNVVITGRGDFSSNNATTGHGGAIFANSAITVTADAGDINFTSNSAGNNGGALNVSFGDVTLTAAAGNVNLTGNTAANNGGAIRVFEGDVIMTGSAGHVVNLSGNTAGIGGGAIYAGGGAINATNVTLNGNHATSGNGGAIYAASDVSVSATEGTSVLSGNQAGGIGGAIYTDAGSLVLNAVGGNITFSGNSQNAGANAAYINNSASTASVTLNVASGNIITFFDPLQQNVANGVIAVTKTGDGIVSFDGSMYSAAADRWSELFANTTVSGGTFEVANDAVYGALSTDAATPAAATSFNSAAGTMVQGGGAGTIRADSITLNGNLSIAGRHMPASAPSVFTLSTNALTLGGGTIYYNSFLDDGSVRHTDLLVLDLHGSAISGQAFISVNNIGGTGQQTVGDGIKLVETNGTGTTAGAFALNGRVDSGAYEYLLFYGGDAATGGNPNDQNWYLRDTYTPPATPDDPNPRPVPIIRPEVPLLTAIQPLALEYGYAMLDSLHERTGANELRYAAAATEERLVRCKDPARHFKCVVRVPVAGANETRWAASGWARLIGTRGLHQPDNFFRRGPNYDYTFGGIQAGLDLYAREQADGALDKAGLYVGYGHISSNVKSPRGIFYGGKAGTVDMDAFTLGGYWTHRSSQGWYTDAVLQGTWYSADAKSVLGSELKPDGFGILGSLETGYSFKLGDGFSLEPQAQIVYQNVSFDNIRTTGAFMQFDDGESLRGRLGLRLSKAWNRAEDGQAPRLVTAWLKANIWHEFLGKTKTSWGVPGGQSAVPFSSYLGGTWGEVGAGVTAQVTEKINVFASGAYNHSLDNRGRQSWDGRLGMTVRW